MSQGAGPALCCPTPLSLLLMCKKKKKRSSFAPTPLTTYVRVDIDIYIAVYPSLLLQQSTAVADDGRAAASVIVVVVRTYHLFFSESNIVGHNSRWQDRTSTHYCSRVYKQTLMGYRTTADGEKTRRRTFIECTTLQQHTMRCSSSSSEIYAEESRHSRASQLPFSSLSRARECMYVMGC